MQIYWVPAETVSGIAVSLVRVTNSEVQTRWPRWLCFSNVLCLVVSRAFSKAVKSALLLSQWQYEQILSSETRQTEWVFSQCAPKCALTSPSTCESVTNLLFITQTLAELEGMNVTKKENGFLAFFRFQNKMCIFLTSKTKLCFKPDNGLEVINRDVQSLWPFTLLLAVYLRRMYLWPSKAFVCIFSNSSYYRCWVSLSILIWLLHEHIYCIFFLHQYGCRTEKWRR